MQRVVWIFLHLPDDVPHPGQYLGLGIVINIALQQFENIEPIARILHKRREQHVQPVVDGDEVVPVARAPSQRGLVSR